MLDFFLKGLKEQIRFTFATLCFSSLPSLSLSFSLFRRLRLSWSLPFSARAPSRPQLAAPLRERRRAAGEWKNKERQKSLIEGEHRFLFPSRLRPLPHPALSPLSRAPALLSLSLFPVSLSLSPQRQERPQQLWRSSPLPLPRRPSSTPWTRPTMPTRRRRPRRRRITLPHPPRARTTSTRASRPCSASSSFMRSR